MKKIIAVVVLIAIFFTGGFFIGMRYAAKDVKIDANVITTKLEKCNDLASARYDYTGLIKYENGKYKFLTKTGFSMTYSAYVKAGIDLSKAEVSVEGNKVYVVVPPAAIMDVVVDEKSLEFYDKQFALLNRRDEADTREAIKAAKEDVKKRAIEAGVLELADEHVVELVEGLLTPITGSSYKLEVTVADEKVVD